MYVDFFFIYIMEFLYQIFDLNSFDYVCKVDNGLNQSLQKYMLLFENIVVVIIFKRKFNNIFVKYKFI